MTVITWAVKLWDQRPCGSADSLSSNVTPVGCFLAVSGQVIRLMFCLDQDVSVIAKSRLEPFCGPKPHMRLLSGSCPCHLTQVLLFLRPSGCREALLSWLLLRYASWVSSPSPLSQVRARKVPTAPKQTVPPHR